MDPVSATLHNMIVPTVHELLVRSNSSLPGGKTPQQFATQGRYSYTPSFVAAALFAVLYLIIFLLNVFQFFWHRAWFWWPMILAVTMELVGYGARAASIKDLDSIAFFVIQTILLLVSPAVMAAACYMAFGRIIMWVVPQEYQAARHLWLPARRITPVFVTADVFSFFVQCIGGGVIASANNASSQNRGKNIILIGLTLQLITFGFFVIASIRFAVVLRTRLRNSDLPRDTNWSLLLASVNVASVIILLRSTYRLVEFAMGFNNVISNHEAFFYCLDALLIFFVAAIFVVVHPGLYIPYLGIRRKGQVFSKNRGRGPFSKLSRFDNSHKTLVEPRVGGEFGLLRYNNQ